MIVSAFGMSGIKPFSIKPSDPENRPVMKDKACKKST